MKKRILILTLAICLLMNMVILNTTSYAHDEDLPEILTSADQLVP